MVKTPFNLMDMTSTTSSFQNEEEGEEQPKNTKSINHPSTPIYKKFYRNALAYPKQFLFVMCLLGAYFCFGAAIGE